MPFDMDEGFFVSAFQSESGSMNYPRPSAARVR